jgi:PAS domain S-box-containing protein
MGKPLRILIVEDSEDDVELLLRELRRSDYGPSYERVETAETMQAALAGQNWDIVISDYNMPQFNAPAALNLLKQSGLDLPFIIVSGAIGEEAAITALKSGAHDFLTKDSLARLGPAIERELREAQSRRERRRAEQALRESEERFRATFEQAAVGIAHVGLDGSWLRVNQRLCDIVGYSREELLEKTFQEITHPEDLETDLAYVRQMLSSEIPTYSREKRYIRKNDALIWINLTVSLMHEPSGEPKYFISVVEDITERKRAEEELKQVAAELARSNAELEQFAYVASHDLQEPLRAVAGMIQLLQKRYAGQLDARADELIQHAVEGTTRMRTLITDLLVYSRVGTRSQPLQQTDMAGILQDALANLAVAVRESQAVITHDPLPTLMADRTQLTQLFQNLIGNAIKFRGDKAPAIHIGVEQQKGGWLFAVRDQGIGMETQHFERIFGVFQRLHTRQEYTGTGIGLAICKKIVERHGGRIWVESEVGQGSTFYFTLFSKESS